MGKSRQKKFHISLAKHLFTDPDFENGKNYTSYLPLSKVFLYSKLVDNMSPTCFKLVVFLLDHAHNVRSTCFDLVENMLPSCREPVENVLSRLEQFQILTNPINKEIKKVINKGNETLTSSKELVPLSSGLLDLNGLKEPPKAPPLNFDHENKLAHDQIVGAWDFFCVSKGLPKIKAWTEKRKKKAQKITEKFSKQEIEQALENLGSSEFCKGKNNRGWVAGIDFFLNEEKFVKILEGEYGRAATKKTVEESDPFAGKIAGV